jgi:hypothetical protein
MPDSKQIILKTNNAKTKQVCHQRVDRILGLRDGAPEAMPNLTEFITRMENESEGRVCGIHLSLSTYDDLLNF